MSVAELLIPFGVDAASGLIVEPEDAERGQACNCVCPGCKAPLLSKHSVDRRRHFSHDSSRFDAKPIEKCPFNSAVAVAIIKGVRAFDFSKFKDLVNLNHKAMGSDLVLCV